MGDSIHNYINWYNTVFFLFILDRNFGNSNGKLHTKNITRYYYASSVKQNRDDLDVFYLIFIEFQNIVVNSTLFWDFDLK